MHKKHLPILLILLALLDFSLILYVQFIFPRKSNIKSPNIQYPVSNISPSISPVPSTSNTTVEFDSIQYPISLILVGDVMLGREVDYQSRKLGNLYAFQNIMDITQDADITFGNLESPFFEGCKETHGGYTFCARPTMIEGLLSSGFDVLSIENNHNLNYGQSGKQQTIDLLTKNNILPSSTQLVIKEIPLNIQYPISNISIGFLSFDLTINNDSTPVLQAVTESRPLVDVLLVSLHWGVEYEKTPRDWQVKMAHDIIDAGAKIIAGHHPHVTQPIEKYGNGLIYYSLGNFIFDQMWSEETKKGIIAKITIEGGEITSHEEIPTYTSLIGQPKIQL